MMTQAEARQFFIGKILDQASIEGVSLSGNERSMLDWSEVEPGCVNDPGIAAGLAAEMSDEAYEEKIAGLLGRAIAREVNLDPRAEQRYQQASSVLSTGDFYLGIIVQEALARRPRKWWKFWA